MFVFAFLACSTYGSAEEIAAQQVSSGAVIMPTSAAPVAYGPEGMMYLYCAAADEGCYGTAELNLCGTSPDFPIQWKPALCDDAFGTFTADSGQMAFVTQIPYPSAGRGDAATPDAVNVAWNEEDGTDLAEEGLDDGWFNLPTTNGVPYVQMISDCGHYHPNIVWGWDVDGDVSLPANVASYGEDYCG
ncbi:MAG: hypothetical protein AAB473_01930 [Patescibacteria group bacterium]